MFSYQNWSVDVCPHDPKGAPNSGDPKAAIQTAATFSLFDVESSPVASASSASSSPFLEEDRDHDLIEDEATLRRTTSTRAEQPPALFDPPIDTTSGMSSAKSGLRGRYHVHEEVGKASLSEVGELNGGAAPWGRGVRGAQQIGREAVDARARTRMVGGDERARTRGEPANSMLEDDVVKTSAARVSGLGPHVVQSVQHELQRGPRKTVGMVFRQTGMSV